MLGSLLALVSGCAPLMTPVEDAQRPQALSYWSRAVDADDARRAQLLREAQRTQASWKVAMLRSLPGPDQDDLQASQRELRALLREGLQDDEAALTRLRLAELERASACTAEAEELRGRLSRIVDIERQIQYER